MEEVMDTIIEFIRARHLNFMLVAVLTVAYLMYYYWGLLVKARNSDEALEEELSRSRSNSRSRHRSPGAYKYDTKSNRRGRKTYRRCYDCHYDE